MTEQVDLFRFVEGSTVYKQTRALYPIEYNSETYEPRSIEHSQVEIKNELERATITVTMDITNPMALRYTKTPVDSVVTLTIFRNSDGVYTTWWKGRLKSASSGSNNKIRLIFDSVFTSMRRPGLRPRYQINCRHMHYGRWCRLNPEDWGIAVNVTAISENVITVDSVGGAPDGTFRGGMIKDSAGMLRFITQQTGTTLNLSRNFLTLEEEFIAGGSVPLPVTIYPGCDHTPTACNGYNNYPNYGGFQWIPKKNPVGGGSIT